jgi:RHS repeat-associated protein
VDGEAVKAHVRGAALRTLALALGLGLVASPGGSQTTELPTGNPTTPEIVRFYHTDALGSVRAVTDRQGDVVARYDYLPYGEQIPQAQGRGDVSGYGDDAGNKHKFTAKERDSESNLDYFGARYYSGAQGRFTSADPVTTPEHITDPQRWNGYAYVRNAPLTYVDPDGRAIDTILDVGFIVYDLYRIGRAVVTGAPVRTEVLALAADVGGALVPVVTGGGMAVRAGAKAASHADDLLHGTEAASHIVQAGKTAERSGEVAKAAEAGKELHRPYIRKSTREAVEAGAAKTPDGKFIDPNTGKVIEGKYDLGHKPGHEFRREKAKAEAEGLTQKQFNDRMNDPKKYQIEDPCSNRGHCYEKKP